MVLDVKKGSRENRAAETGSTEMHLYWVERKGQERTGQPRQGAPRCSRIGCEERIKKEQGSRDREHWDAVCISHARICDSTFPLCRLETEAYVILPAPSPPPQQGLRAFHH